MANPDWLDIIVTPGPHGGLRVRFDADKRQKEFLGAGINRRCLFFAKGVSEVEAATYLAQTLGIQERFVELRINTTLTRGRYVLKVPEKTRQRLAREQKAKA